jgi:hypothetical protein
MARNNNLKFPMPTRSRFIAAVLLLVWIAYARSAGNQHESSQKTNETGPPGEVCSRDNKYCVHMIPTPGHPDKCTLRISASGGTTLAEFPIMGYLLDVFFSPDDAHVAINNRRANAGDYLWVISLPEGRALKVPDDVAEDLGKTELGKIKRDNWLESTPEILALCPTCTKDDLRHPFLYSTGWKSSTELKVVEELEFSKGWIAGNTVCQISGTGLSVAEHKVAKESRPSELVRRAWTWSPFHSN